MDLRSEATIMRKTEAIEAERLAKQAEEEVKELKKELKRNN